MSRSRIGKVLNLRSHRWLIPLGLVEWHSELLSNLGALDGENHKPFQERINFLKQVEAFAALSSDWFLNLIRLGPSEHRLFRCSAGAYLHSPSEFRLFLLFGVTIFLRFIFGHEHWRHQHVWVVARGKLHWFSGRRRLLHCYQIFNSTAVLQ